MPETTNHGVALHYETTGEGEPLLLIPGLGSDASNWPQVDKRLAERFQLVLMDNRGAGRSDSPPPPYAMADMAGDCLCVLDHLGLESAHVLGHSMGGAIALELAINHP
ncbi:MAG: alpha/beta fold hydrolase, partial [Desulfovibrionaceae bacterium]